MEAIIIKNHQELVDFSIEMKISAAGDPLDHCETDETKYCKTKEEYAEMAANPAMQKMIEAKKSIQVIALKNRPYTLVLTVEPKKDGNEKHWHLSMSSPLGPKELSDETAGYIAKTFFPEGHKAIGSIGLRKDVRHFISQKVKPKNV